MIRLTKLTLDLAKNEFFNLTELKLRQFDTGYALVFTLTDSWREANVDAANLGFRAIKPDKTVIDIKGTGFSKDSEGYWVFNLPRELTQLASPAQKAHIYVQDGENTYTSSDITFFIEPQFGENSGVSAENIEEIRRLLENAHALNTELQRIQNNLQNEKDTLISNSKADAKNAIDKIKNDGENAINKATQDGANAVNKIIADGGNAIDGITTSGNNAVKTVKSDGEAAVNKVIADGGIAVTNLTETGNSTVKKIKDDGEAALNHFSENSTNAISDIQQNAKAVTGKIESEGTSAINDFKAAGAAAAEKIKTDGEAVVTEINKTANSTINSISEEGEKAVTKVSEDGKNKIDELDEKASNQRTDLQNDYNSFKESLNNDFNSLKYNWDSQLGALEQQMAALQGTAGAISSDLSTSKNTLGELQENIKNTQTKIDNIKNDLANIDFKGIADTAKTAKDTADSNSKVISNINDQLSGIKEGTKVVDLINNAGKVKTVSLNGGAKIDPDVTGNIDLSVPKNESSSVKYYKLELLKTEADFNLQFQNGTIKLITDEHGTPHLLGEITFNYTLGKALSEWDSAASTTITRLAAQFLLVNIYDEKDYFVTPEEMRRPIQTISPVLQLGKTNYYYSNNMLNTEGDEKGGRGYITFRPEYGSKWADYLSSIKIDY